MAGRQMPEHYRQTVGRRSGRQPAPQVAWFHSSTERPITYGMLGV